MADRRLELLATLRAGLDLIVKLVAGQFVFLLRGVEFERALFELASLSIEICQSARQSSESDAQVVVLVQDQFATERGVFVVEFTESTGLDGLAADNAQSPFSAGELLADPDQIDHCSFELSARFDLAGLEL